MEKRNSKRIPASIEVKFDCCHMEYSGIATNLSGNGIFIRTNEMCFPFDSEIEISIFMNEDILRIPARLIRLTMLPNVDDGIGFKISNPSQKYLELVDNQRCI